MPISIGQFVQNNNLGSELGRRITDYGQLVTFINDQLKSNNNLRENFASLVAEGREDAIDLSFLGDKNTQQNFKNGLLQFFNQHITAWEWGFRNTPENISHRKDLIRTRILGNDENRKKLSENLAWLVQQWALKNKQEASRVLGNNVNKLTQQHIPQTPSSAVAAAPSVGGWDLPTIIKWGLTGGLGLLGLLSLFQAGEDEDEHNYLPGLLLLAGAVLSYFFGDKAVQFIMDKFSNKSQQTPQSQSQQAPTQQKPPSPPQKPQASVQPSTPSPPLQETTAVASSGVNRIPETQTFSDHEPFKPSDGLALNANKYTLAPELDIFSQNIKIPEPNSIIPETHSVLV
jgi:hypothetical protein